MSKVKNCTTCVHRGFGGVGGYCNRTGFFCGIELRYGGRCAQGQELKLWQQRPSWFQRMKIFFNFSREGAGSNEQGS